MAETTQELAFNTDASHPDHVGAGSAPKAASFRLAAFMRYAAPPFPHKAFGALRGPHWGIRKVSPLLF